MIAVATPILNESFFIDGWLRCVVRFADEVVITDGGSTDDTWIKIMRAVAFHPEIRWDVVGVPQTGKPYSDDWNEGQVRNDLLRRVKSDYVVLLDADELINKGDVKRTVARMKRGATRVAYLSWVTFWGDTEHVRVSTLLDRRWNGTRVPRIIRTGTVQYNHKRHHCTLQWQPWWYRMITGLPLFHMHYAYGTSRLKRGNGREFDFMETPITQPAVKVYSGTMPE